MDVSEDINPFTLESFSSEKEAYMAFFDVMNWADAFSHHSFDTLSIQLSKEDAKNIVNAYREIFGIRVEKEKGEGKEWQYKLSKLLKEHGGAWFVRLGSRSPKDAAMDESIPGFSKAVIEEALEKDTTTPNGKIQIAMAATNRLLCITTAEHAIWLLQRSERVYSDLVHSLDLKRGVWDATLILRKWNPKVTLENEFRGFVCHQKLCALSQYNDFCAYEGWKGKEKDIINTCLERWNQVLEDPVAKSFVKRFPALVVDFAVLNKECIIVELNPFGPCTGASLFDWRSDRALLLGGRDPWTKELLPHKERELPLFVQEVRHCDVVLRILKEPRCADWEHLKVLFPMFAKVEEILDTL